MIQSRQNMLRPLAAKYIWWQTPEEALSRPHRVIAQIMNLGDFDDVRTLVSVVPPEQLKEVLHNAEAGQFSERSWAYWHYSLEMVDIDMVPALPTRKFT